MEKGISTYLDYETFLNSSFSSAKFANEVVLATNNSSDSPLDLTTPLSRVLFDVQEVDTHIDQVANHSALPILGYTRANVQAGQTVLEELEKQIFALHSSYSALYREILMRHDTATDTSAAAIRLWQTLRLGRAIARCVTLGRQLEVQMIEVKASGVPGEKKGSASALVRSAYTMLSFRQMFESKPNSVVFLGLDRVLLIQNLRKQLVDPNEKLLISYAERLVGQFSVSVLATLSSDTTPAPGFQSPSSYTEMEDIKSRTIYALKTLYLLSPTGQATSQVDFNPSILLSSLQDYIKRAITSSLAGLTSALTMLPKLDRTLTEISARCQNVVALELLLQTVEPPIHPLIASHGPGTGYSDEATLEGISLLQPLLLSLDTSSLVSYFWRSMASLITIRMQKIVRDGGAATRTLRNNRDRIRDALKNCVYRGSQLPLESLGKTRVISVGNWDREAAVMAGSVISPLGRFG